MIIHILALSTAFLAITLVLIYFRIEQKSIFIKTLSILLISIAWITAISIRYDAFGSDIWGELAVTSRTIAHHYWNAKWIQYHDYYMYVGFILFISSLKLVSGLPLIITLKIISISCFVSSIIMVISIAKSFIKSKNVKSCPILISVLPLLFSPVPVLCITKSCLSMISLFTVVIMFAISQILEKKRLPLPSMLLLFVIAISIPFFHITSAILLAFILMLAAPVTLLLRLTSMITYRKHEHYAQLAPTVILKVTLTLMLMLIIGTVLFHLYLTMGLERYVFIAKYTLATLWSKKEALRNPVIQNILSPTYTLRFYLLLALYLIHGIGLLLFLFSERFKGNNSATLVKVLCFSSLTVSLVFLVIKRLGVSLYLDRVLMFHFLLGGFLSFFMVLIAIGYRSKPITKYLALSISLLVIITVFLWPANLMSTSYQNPIKLRDIRYFDGTNRHILDTASFVYNFLEYEQFKRKILNTYTINLYVDQYTFLPLYSGVITRCPQVKFSISEDANVTVISTINIFTRYYVYEKQLIDIVDIKRKLLHTIIVYNTGFSFVSVR